MNDTPQTPHDPAAPSPPPPPDAEESVAGEEDPGASIDVAVPPGGAPAGPGDAPGERAVEPAPRLSSAPPEACQSGLMDQS